MSDHPYAVGQPTAEVVDAYDEQKVWFSDGAVGNITNWIDILGDCHTEPVDHVVAVVVKHPGDVKQPWYSLSLFEGERRPYINP